MSTAKKEYHQCVDAAEDVDIWRYEYGWYMDSYIEDYLVHRSRVDITYCPFCGVKL